MTGDQVVSGLILSTIVGRGPLASTHNLHAMECPREVRPYGELFLFFLKKEPMVLRELVRFGRSIPVEAVKACALIGLHMMIEEISWAVGKWLLCVVKKFG